MEIICNYNPKDSNYDNVVASASIEHALERNTLNKKHLGRISSRRVTATEALMDINEVSYADYICGWNRYAMKLMGIWPEERKFNQISSYVVILPITVMVLFITVPQTINLYFIWSDFDLIVENLSVANITVTIAVLKTAIFWLSGRYLRILLADIDKDRKEATIEEEVAKMTNIAKICRTLSMGSILSAQFVVFLQVSMKLLLIHSNGRILIVQAYFPYDALSTPNFELTVIGQIMGSIYAAGTYATVDIFVTTVVLHTCGQFSNIKHKLRNLRPRSGREFQIKLARIINKHDSLRRFIDTVEEQFNGMLLIQMVGCTMQLCVQCFQAILSLTGENHGVFLVEMTFLAVYVMYILIQIYLYCYIGEQLFSESMGVIDAAYECNWYDLSPNEAKSLLMIMRRAQLPLRITAGKFCSFDHRLFSTILKTSMSYLSVLYAMKTKDE